MLVPVKSYEQNYITVSAFIPRVLARWFKIAKNLHMIFDQNMLLMTSFCYLSHISYLDPESFQPSNLILSATSQNQLLNTICVTIVISL